MPVRNPFEGLQFVSCGPRGIEPFAFDQFVSVFEYKVWVLILSSMLLVIVTIVLLHKKGFRFWLTQMGAFSIFKVLVEQGNPFPPFFEKDIKMMFLTMATLFSAIVLTNSFKSENVYNIVLPRKQVSYHNIDELIEDNITIYTPISLVRYYFMPDHNKCILSNVQPDISRFEMCKHMSFSVVGWSDFYNKNHIVPDFIKLFNYTQIHSMTLKALTETIEMLNDLFQAGIIHKNNVKVLSNGQILKDAFHSAQKDLMRSSLNNCSKIAWVLQAYEAQTLHRSLKKSRKHSDVGSNAYTNPTLSFKYIRSHVPSLLLKRFSWMPTNGLFEWWPNFINKTGIILGGEHILPPTPNMSGNILVVFVLLGGGLSIAIICIVFEIKGKIILFVVFAYKFCETKLYVMMFKVVGFHERHHSNVVIIVQSNFSSDCYS